MIDLLSAIPDFMKGLILGFILGGFVGIFFSGD